MVVKSTSDAEISHALDKVGVVNYECSPLSLALMAPPWPLEFFFVTRKQPPYYAVTHFVGQYKETVAFIIILCH